MYLRARAEPRKDIRGCPPEFFLHNEIFSSNRGVPPAANCLEQPAFSGMFRRIRKFGWPPSRRRSFWPSTPIRVFLSTSGGFPVSSILLWNTAIGGFPLALNGAPGPGAGESKKKRPIINRCRNFQDYAHTFRSVFFLCAVEAAVAMTMGTGPFWDFFGQAGGKPTISEPSPNGICTHFPTAGSSFSRVVEEKLQGLLA